MKVIGCGWRIVISPICRVVRKLERDEMGGLVFAQVPFSNGFLRSRGMREGGHPEIGHRNFVAHVAQISRGNAQANAVNSTDLA